MVKKLLNSIPGLNHANKDLRPPGSTADVADSRLNPKHGPEARRKQASKAAAPVKNVNNAVQPFSKLESLDQINTHKFCDQKGPNKRLQKSAQKILKKLSFGSAKPGEFVKADLSTKVTGHQGDAKMVVHM